MIGLMKYQVWTLEPKRSKSDVTYCQEVYIYIYEIQGFSDVGVWSAYRGALAFGHGIVSRYIPIFHR